MVAFYSSVYIFCLSIINNKYLLRLMYQLYNLVPAVSIDLSIYLFNLELNC